MTDLPCNADKLGVGGLVSYLEVMHVVRPSRKGEVERVVRLLDLKVMDAAERLKSKLFSRLLGVVRVCGGLFKDDLKAGAVARVVGIIREEGRGEIQTAGMEHLSRLVVESNDACKEFVESHGVECVKEALARSEGGGDRVTVGCLIALSQVARGERRSKRVASSMFLISDDRDERSEVQ